MSYAGHLGDLEKKAQKAGVLDQVLEVRKKLKEFRSDPQAEYKYDKLKKMRAIYDGERMKRRNRIVDELKLALGQYQIELKGIQKALTMEDKVDEAMSFAAWLTMQGRKNGELTEKQEYRLPTDHEWSCAVGLGGIEDAEASPVSKNKAILNEFPWGKGYPPPKGAGNYNGEEGVGILPRQPVTGYDDGFIYTSPAGTYTANQYGLYDLGGNVWEWVQDWFNPNQKQKRVFRGAAYIWESEPALLSSHRGLSEPGKQIQMVGFRVVIAPVE